MVAEFILHIVDQTLRGLLEGVETALPRVIAGLVFALVAYVAIRLILAALKASLGRYYTERQQLVAQLFVAVAGIFLWFAAALTFLKIVGMGDIAASLGTAVGFIALGVSYALSAMIEDTVAGVYLLRDPDFEIGDRVAVGGTEGTVSAIELRKSRFTLEDGDTWVVANRDVEAKWTKHAEE
ncbi:mechanosensitive ion channel domain-containing protein [Natronomonas sp.]|uniref:mechanosensitive ion channel domain-containing protein n=1 Tax=Natronomonas sp. TaxID=2184060 RepID=UPI002FC3BBB9